MCVSYVNECCFFFFFAILWLRDYNEEDPEGGWSEEGFWGGENVLSEHASPRNKSERSGGESVEKEDCVMCVCVFCRYIERAYYVYLRVIWCDCVSA